MPLTPEEESGLLPITTLNPASGGNMAAPASKTSGAAGEIDTPNTVGSVADGDLSAPVVKSRIAAGEIDDPNVVGSEQKGSVAIPVVKTRAAAGELSEPNTVGSVTDGQLSAPVAREGVQAQIFTLVLDFANNLYDVAVPSGELYESEQAGQLANPVTISSVARPPLAPI